MNWLSGYPYRRPLIGEWHGIIFCVSFELELDEEQRFMYNCRDTGGKPCDTCGLRFKCFTESWKEDDKIYFLKNNDFCITEEDGITQVDSFLIEKKLYFRLKGSSCYIYYK
jgi:hypothetical protein